MLLAIFDCRSIRGSTVCDLLPAGLRDSGVSSGSEVLARQPGPGTGARRGGAVMADVIAGRSVIIDGHPDYQARDDEGSSRGGMHGEPGSNAGGKEECTAGKKGGVGCLQGKFWGKAGGLARGHGGGCGYLEEGIDKHPDHQAEDDEVCGNKAAAQNDPFPSQRDGENGSLIITVIDIVLQHYSSVESSHRRHYPPPPGSERFSPAHTT